MDADPIDLNFRWRANSSMSNSNVDSIRSNGTSSVATYRVRYRHGPEVVVCQASNEIGASKEPCYFSLVPAGKPSFDMRKRICEPFEAYCSRLWERISLKQDSFWA